jgi:hypothetical protein
LDTLNARSRECAEKFTRDQSLTESLDSPWGPGALGGNWPIFSHTLKADNIEKRVAIMGTPQAMGTPPLAEEQGTKSWWIPRAMATAVLIAAVAHTAGGGVAFSASSVARIGSPAPDFTLRLLDGKSVTLSSLKGKPVVVNFWHSG